MERNINITEDRKKEDHVEETRADISPEKEKDAKNGQPDYLAQLQRLQAEFSNYRKRTEQQRAEWHDYAQKEVVSQLLPVLDDFDHLFNHHEGQDSDFSKEGVKLIYDKLRSILEKLGVETIDTKDSMFDPSMHEAIHARETKDDPQDKILQVWQKGYLYKGKLLRPAKVVVAKRKEEQKINDE